MRIANANAIRAVLCGRCRYILVLCPDLTRLALPIAYKVCQACGELIYERWDEKGWYSADTLIGHRWSVIKRPADVKKI